MGNIPKLRFPEFTGEWEEKRLGEIGVVSMCHRIYENQTSDTGDIPFYKIGTFGNMPDSFISKELFKEYKDKYHYPQKGDILLSAAGTIGRTVEYDGEDSYYQDSNIVWLKVEENKPLLNCYLKYIYETVEWTKLLEGSTIKRLYNKDLLSLKVYLPNIKEQEKIASFLSAVDEQIETKRENLKNLEDMKQGFMQKIFSKELRFKDEDGSDYPEWEEKKLGEIGRLRNGYPFSSSDYVENGKYAILTITNVSGGIYVNDNNLSCLNQVPSSLAEYQKLKKEDILVSMTGNVGRVSKNNKYGNLLNQRVGLIEITYTLDREFLFHSLKTGDFEKKMILSGQGAAQKNISKGDIESYCIQLPSLPEQEKIASFLSALDEKIEIEKEVTKELKLIKKGLLQQMFI